MEKNYVSSAKIILSKSLLATVLTLLVLSNNLKAQLSDNFNGPLLTSGAAWGSWQSNLMFGYLPLTSSAGTAFSNQWFWSNGTGLTPAAPAPFSAGGMLKYNARNSAFAPGGAIDTGCAYIASPPLDFSGRAGAAANVSFYLWHDYYWTNLADPLSRSTADSVVVYASNTDQLTGAVRLGVVAVDTTGFGVGSAWRLSTFAIPAVPQFNGCTNVIIMVVAYTWNSYRNIYLDNFSVNTFPTAQAVTAATLVSQNTLNVSAGSVNNQIVGLKVSVCGSTTPKQLDSIMFNPTGTNIPGDVANAKLWYTGNSPAFSTIAPAVQVFSTVNPPINNVGYNNSLGFGNCAAPVTLTTGDNYFWLTYDIKTTGAGATPGDIVDADFVGIKIDGDGAGCVAANSTAYGTAQSLPGGCLIGLNYSYATYFVGTSYAGYTINDFIASVHVTSAAGNPLFNQEHDVTSWAGCTGTAGQNCSRHSPHPPDYTLFGSANLGPTKDRSLNLKLGQGIRTGTTADKISIAAGTWFSSNCVRAWIDFNGDGDFDDNYVGAGGTIYESINNPLGYALSDNQAIGSLGSIPGAFPAAKIGDDWNEFNIQVPDVGELPTVGGTSGGPAVKLGSVRMRVREVWATTAFTPTSTQTYGETEDYDVALVDNCPAPGSKYCKWLGGAPNPTDWMTAANWCPGIPTALDTALISPNGSGYYPIITTDQMPECATLRVYTPATVTIDAGDKVVGGALVANAGKFKAYHNVEIGESVGTAAQFIVKSAYNDTVVTGVPSAAGNVVISPFRGDKQDHKIQFIYTPTELSVMGLKSGDLLKDITFYIRSTVALGAGTLNTFTVKVWQMDNSYVYPAILLASTHVAVNNGVSPLPNTGGITVTTAYGPALFNIPAIAANVTTPVTITFTTRPIVDITKYLCFEITRDNFGAAGVGYPVLYESSLLRNCLSMYNQNTNLTSSTVASNITGIGNGIGAANVNLANGILNTGLGASGGTGLPYAFINGTTFVFRPTSQIGVTRQYSKYNIEVGGNWINNNTSGLPLGFVAGWSRVKMLNNFVPGVHPNNDKDTIMGTEVTTFNELEINDPNSVLMLVQGINGGNLGLTIDSSLVMTNGQLELNQHRALINNPLTWGIQRTAGSILSENVSNYNKVEWKMNTTTGAHLIPFGATIAAADYVPVTINPTAGDVGNVTVSTYRTIASNLPIPSLPVAVNNLFNSACVDNSANTVDRFWQIDRSTATAVSVNLTLGYTASENTTGKPYTSMVAQRYDQAAAKACGVPTGRWSNPTGVGQSATSQSTSNVGYLSVTANGVTNFSPWAVAVVESPLPLQLLNFDAKLIDDKVKVYWSVANEKNIDEYAVLKTTNKSDFNFIGAKKPVGPGVNGFADYELWDANPIKGTQYYQLKSLNDAGEETYSNLVRVDYSVKMFGLSNVTSESATGKVNVQFINDSDLPLTISVTDMFGRNVYSRLLGSMPQGLNTIEIPASVSSGVYTLSLSNDNNRDSQTFVK